jgi:hypothetical protein
VLGMWFQETEGAKFWIQVLSELRHRGVHDILICWVEGLTGFREAIEAIFPRTTVQTCVVHLIRHSLKYVPRREREDVARDLKPIYTAVDADAAQRALGAFDEKWASGSRRVGIGCEGVHRGGVQLRLRGQRSRGWSFHCFLGIGRGLNTAAWSPGEGSKSWLRLGPRKQRRALREVDRCETSPTPAPGGPGVRSVDRTAPGAEVVTDYRYDCHRRFGNARLLDDRGPNSRWAVAELADTARDVRYPTRLSRVTPRIVRAKPTNCPDDSLSCNTATLTRTEIVAYWAERTAATGTEWRAPTT